MSGIIRGLSMSKEAEFCRLVKADDKVCAFLCRKLDLPQDEKTYGLGIFMGDRLAGGILYSDLRPNSDVWMSIFTQNKRWCCRRVLRGIFEIAFNVWNCRRINALIDCDNIKSLKLALGVGFKIEGIMREYRQYGKNVFVLGMLKNECKFL